MPQPVLTRCSARDLCLLVYRAERDRGFCGLLDAIERQTPDFHRKLCLNIEAWEKLLVNLLGPLSPQVIKAALTYE